MKTPRIHKAMIPIVSAMCAILALAGSFIAQASRKPTPLRAAVSASRTDSGLFWVLGYQRAVKAENLERFVPADSYGKDASGLGADFSRAPASLDFAYLAGRGDGAPGITSAEVYEILSRENADTVAVGASGIFEAAADRSAAAALEDLFGVAGTGWSGRRFLDLADREAVPSRVREAWSASKGEWLFRGAGLLLANADGRIVVLEDGKDLTTDPLAIRPDPSLGADYGLASDIPYTGWFSLFDAAPDASVPARLEIGATAEGARKLAEAGIPRTAPAVVATVRAGGTYFLAGAFGEEPQGIRRIVPYGYAEYKRKAPYFIDGTRGAAFWKLYVPVVSKAVRAAAAKAGVNKVPPLESGEGELATRISGKRMEIRTEGKWTPITIKGVNLGLALPNKWFTEMPRDPLLYRRWLGMIADMNANAVRLYTLAPPEFYRAFRDFNRVSPRKIFLLQEIWPDENVPGRDYLNPAYSEAYEREIRLDIDAVHGKADIPERRGRAWGEYSSDASPWTIAYLIGREMEPEEIEETDRRHAGWTYAGKYVSAPEGSPSEAWAARNCDIAAAYEAERYGRRTPTAVVGWPILDPVSHDSEWNEKGDKKLEFNDRAVFDIDHIETGPDNAAGFFGAYHIYPNYPDFMNNEVAYDDYRDEKGRLRYGGYLREFARSSAKHPLLVAEFGLANGMATAHVNPDGYDHGSLSERETAEGIPRLFRAIVREGYLGGIVFEWIDEWAKKTWTTEATMLPYDAQVHWRNEIDPEQNYGLLAMEARRPRAPVSRRKGTGAIAAAEAYANTEFLYLRFDFDAASFLAGGGRFMAGIDTYDRSRGQFRYPGAISESAPSGMEFLVEVEAGGAKLLATPDYNAGEYRFHSRARSDGRFEEIRPIVNKARVRKDGSVVEAIRAERLRMAFGSFDEPTANVQADADGLTLRLPWNALSVGNPLDLTVIDDSRPFNYLPERDALRTMRSDGIGVSALMTKEGRVVARFPEGDAWVVPPPALDPDDWRERPKAAYYSLRDEFARVP